MATAVLPDPVALPDAPADAPAPAPTLERPDPRTDEALKALLTSTHAAYRTGVLDWLGAERRMYGGAPALSELQPFHNESARDYAIRQAKATYVPFPRLFAAANAGHLLRQMPTPHYGSLGEVRPLAERPGAPTLAELIDYNVDGVGQDGTQWNAWWAQVAAAVHGPGFGWVYVESPARDQLRQARGRAAQGQTTEADVRGGLRPYLVYLPPGRVPNWHVADGRREWAVVRVPARAPRFVGAEYKGNDAALGYLLLVRRGWQGFGPAFAGGGWWTFAADFAPLASGDWSRTRGEIPLTLVAYETSAGVEPPAGGDGVGFSGVPGARGPGDPADLSEVLVPSGGGAPRDGIAAHRPCGAYPAVARSGTAELGNVAVALMDAISERDYDAREAAASGLTVMGVDPNAEPGKPNNFNDFAFSKGARSRLSPLPFATVETGFDTSGNPTRTVVVPTIQDDSTGAVPAAVYETLIASKFTEAREIMARELTAAPTSSGASKAAGFAEGKSPRLALLAANLETAMNTALYFLELRAGTGTPSAYVTLPRDYDLAPVLDTIDAALARLQTSGLRSATLAVDLLVRGLDEDGLMPESVADRAAVIAELKAAAAQAATLAAGPSALDRLLGATGAAVATGGGTPTTPPALPVAPPATVVSATSPAV